MKRIIPCFLIILLLTSCDAMFFSFYNPSFYTKKTTINTFEQLDDPIVILATVGDDVSLMGLPGLFPRYKQYGDVFVVIDRETNSIYEWVFLPSRNGDSSVLWRAIEMGENPTRYYSSASDGRIGCLDPTKTSLTIFDTDFDSYYLEPCIIKGTKCVLMDHFSNHGYETFWFFDAEKGRFSEKTAVIDCEMNIQRPLEADDGTLWSILTREDENVVCYDYLYRFDFDNCTLDGPYFMYPVRQNVTEGQIMTSILLCIRNGLAYISVSSRDATVNQVLVIDLFAEGTEKPVIKTIDLAAPEECTEPFMSSAYFYQNKLYGVIHGWHDEHMNCWICEVDTESGESRILENSRMEIFATENTWFKGNRIYFMHGNARYMYFDLEKWEKSVVYKIDYSSMSIYEE